jgi:hypothetical protein
MKMGPGIGDYLAYTDKWNDKYILEITHIFMSDSCSIVNYQCDVIDTICETLEPITKKGTFITVHEYDLWLNCNLEEISEKYPEAFL